MSVWIVSLGLGKGPANGIIGNVTGNTALFARLITPGRDPDEVLQLLFREYSQGRDEGDGSITLSSGQDPELRIEFGKKGPVAVLPLSGFDQARFDAAVARVAEALDGPQERTVFSTVLFTSRPVDSFYRDPGGHFQILPVATNAPQPGGAWSDHPFLFEYTCQASPDAVLSSSRAQRHASEWTWFLNAILRDSIKSRGSAASRHWILWPEATSPIEDAVHWAQEFYAYEGLDPRPGTFSERSVAAMGAAPLEEYYSDRSVVLGTSFQLPESFSTLTSWYTELASEVRRRFLRAARWVYAADRIGPSHYASSYVALVTAIESLVDNDAPKICRCCGQNQFTATSRFRDFLGRVTEGRDPTAVKDFYAVRSKLVHGVAALEVDEVRFWTFKPSVNDEMDRLRRMRQIATVALIRWLQEQWAQSAKPAR